MDPSTGEGRPVAAPMGDLCQMPLLVESKKDDVNTPDHCVMQGRLKNSESLSKLYMLLDHLSGSRKLQLSKLILSFPLMFSNTPWRTHLIEHDIDIGDEKPIRQRLYRASPEKRDQRLPVVNP